MYNVLNCEVTKIDGKEIFNQRKMVFQPCRIGSEYVYGIMSSFLLTFYTDIMFSDASGDYRDYDYRAGVGRGERPAGLIVDRTRTRLGK